MLDSIAVSQLAKSVDDDKIPPVGYSNDTELAKLKGVDGLVGIAEDDEDPAQAEETSLEITSTAPVGEEADLEANQADHNSTHSIPADSRTAVALSTLKLVRGGSGLITKKHAPPRKKRWRKKRYSKEALLEKEDAQLDDSMP